jgi:hypothetical protein
MAMLIVCPLCDYSNQVVDGYKPGAILLCNCGVFLEFVGIGAQPRVLEKDEAVFPDSSLTAKSSPKAG